MLLHHFITVSKYARIMSHLVVEDLMQSVYQLHAKGHDDKKKKACL